MNAPRKFVDDFSLVSAHYALPPDEIDEAKAAAKRDFEAAETCFAAMADQIRRANNGGTPA